MSPRLKATMAFTAISGFHPMQVQKFLNVSIYWALSRHFIYSVIYCNLSKHNSVRSCLLFAAAAAESLSRVRLCATPQTAAHQAPLSLGFSRREHEWAAISFSSAWKWKVKVKSLSHVWLLGTPWTAAYQALPSMGFSRQEDWSGLPLPSIYCLLSLKKIEVAKGVTQHTSTGALLDWMWM